MQAHRPQLILAFCGCLLGAGGCSTTWAPRWAFWDTGEWRDPNIEAPIQRIQRYQKLAKAAADKTPEEQQQVSEQLAREIAAELDPLVRAQIVHTLAAYPTKISNNVLLAALKDVNEEGKPTREVRIASCDAWGARGGPEAANALRAVLRDQENDIDVRLAAVRALGQVRDPSAVPALAVALEDTDPAMRYRTMESLQKVTGRNYGFDVTLWRQFTEGKEVPEKEESLVEEIRRILF